MGGSLFFLGLSLASSQSVCEPLCKLKHLCMYRPSVVHHHQVERGHHRNSGLRSKENLLSHTYPRLCRARWGDCGHNFFFAYPCKGRGVCPLFYTQRMGEPTAHLTSKSHALEPLRRHIPDRSMAVWKPKTCDILVLTRLNFQFALVSHSAVQSAAGLAPCSRRCRCSSRHVRNSAKVAAACMFTST